MCLVDDLMERFRPTVDCTVARLLKLGCHEVTNEAKRTLVGTLTIDMHTDRGVSPLQSCLERAAQSLARSFENKTASLNLPDRLVGDSLPVAS